MNNPQSLPSSDERANNNFAGLLYDFMGFLTTHETRWKFSSYDDASPAVDAIKQFAAKRGLKLEEANVLNWVDALAPSPSGTEAQADLVERLKQEAQIHAQEARTANATIAEIYQIVTGNTGEPGNWNGAEPVRKCIEELRAQLATAAPAVGAPVATIALLHKTYDALLDIQKIAGVVVAPTLLRELFEAIKAGAEAHPDDLAVDAFAAAMKDKMAKQRAKGYGGWETCPVERLQEMLFTHIPKGDPVDVANFAMMLSARGERTVYEDQWVYDITGKWPGAVNPPFLGDPPAASAEGVTDQALIEASNRGYAQGLKDGQALAAPAASLREQEWDYEPQLVEHGAEPSLRKIIKHYYSSHGIGFAKADKLTAQYIDAQRLGREKGGAA